MASSIIKYPPLSVKKGFETVMKQIGVKVNVDSYKADVNDEIQGVVMGIQSEYQEPTPMQKHQFVDLTVNVGLFTKRDALLLAEAAEEIKKIDFAQKPYNDLVDFKVNRMWVSSDTIDFSETDSDGSVQAIIIFNIQYLKI